MNEANNVLTIKTVQIQPIRNMITAVKDILDIDNLAMVGIDDDNVYEVIENELENI